MARKIRTVAIKILAFNMQALGLPTIIVLFVLSSQFDDACQSAGWPQTSEFYTVRLIYMICLPVFSLSMLPELVSESFTKIKFSQSA